MIYSRSSLAHACFFCFIACFTGFYGKRESKTRCSDLFFSLIICYYLFLIKSCMSCISITYQLSYLTLPICELLGRFGNCFMHLWGISLDLVSLLLTISNGILMHSNISCNYLLQQPMISYGWLLYTSSVRIINPQLITLDIN